MTSSIPRFKILSDGIRRDFCRLNRVLLLAGLSAFSLAACTHHLPKQETAMTKKLVKKGTIDLLMMETSPIVFKGHCYRMEYVHENYYGNLSGDTYYRCVDIDTGAITPPFGHGYAMGNVFVWQDKAYLTCADKPADASTKANDTFYLMTSDDLVHWSKPTPILHGEGWNGFNTSICRAGDRFLMVFELGAPAEKVGVPFTMFFAESTDLIHWNIIEDAIFGKDFYTGSPLLRHYGDYSYFFYLHRDDQKEIWEMWAVRSKDLKNWEFAPNNPVLTPEPELDKVCAPGVVIRKDMFDDRMTNGLDINNSDMDMCEWNGKVYIVYSWGNQYYRDNIAYAEFEGTEQEFCESFWK